MSDLLLNLLKSDTLAPPVPEAAAEQLAQSLLNTASGLSLYPRSISAIRQTLFCLGRREQDGQKYLAILSSNNGVGAKFTGQTTTITLAGLQINLTIAPTSAGNAAALREVLPFLVARPLGLKKSAGCGDRFGLEPRTFPGAILCNAACQ